MRIVIVGGGCSGALVAFQLLNHGCKAQVTIVEPRAQLGRGVAYSTAFSGHLLNVVAEKMSALPSEPGHFLDWLRVRQFPDAAPGLFAPRQVYGEYLSGLLDGQLTANGDHFRHLRNQVVSIEWNGANARLTLDDGAVLEADRVVLALGNPTASNVPAGMEDRWHPSPWVGDALRLRAPGERILLIGAGQTAVDAILTLQSQPGGSRIHMLSRSGNLPQVHPTTFATLPPPAIAPEYGVRRILHELRTEIRRARDRELPWQAVIDALRPVSNQIWHGLPLAERLRFQRHLKTLWETHRSRMAPSIYEQMNRYTADGRVRILAGRLRQTLPVEDGIDVQVALRRGGAACFRVDRIINCIGINEHYHVRPRPLIGDLLRQGLASANDLGIGFHADEYGGLVGPASNALFTLGPPRRGELFETIAVPEIRTQAEALAGHLIASA